MAALLHEHVREPERERERGRERERDKTRQEYPEVGRPIGAHTARELNYECLAHTHTTQTKRFPLAYAAA